MSQHTDAIYHYHQRTKHSLQRYAAGPDGLDWDNQPNPFRNFGDIAQYSLPLSAEHQLVRFRQLYEANSINAAPLNQHSLGTLFEISLGLAAWKQHDTDRWSLRCNPSSGNLHPTEAYALLADTDGISAGIYHYQSLNHSLEQRCPLPNDSLSAALPAHHLLLGLSSIHWREAWKYGERAFRYCQHDTGHALAALRYAAATLGWTLTLLDEWSDEEISALLGLDRSADFANAEPEDPELLVLINTQPSNFPIRPDAAALCNLAKNAQWYGQANSLSPHHIIQDWPIITETAQAANKPRTEPINAWQAPLRPPLLPSHCSQTATQLFKQRRSAQGFDGHTLMPADVFWRILDALQPRTGVLPWDVWPWSPRVHLMLFVHRVEGIAPGLYFLPRHEQALDLFKAESSQQAFVWEALSEAPEHVPLYRLVQAKTERAAGTLSCHQNIAADSAFSLAMLVEFDEPLQAGAWMYKRLFWEAGILGQVLYLEAEAAGLRGTGIGCYFDDSVHEVAGLQSTKLQSLYHFTIGAALVDNRLQTLPPYPDAFYQR